MTVFDLTINNALVLDGTGAPTIRGAVGIRDGRIAAVSTGAEPLRGNRTIDAAGSILCPGFIDLHSHADFSLLAAPQAQTQLAQGVTTLLTGNCGFSPFPVGSLDALKSATAFLRPDLSWCWQDAGGFVRHLQQQDPAINVALQVGHGALRIAAMGDPERAPTAEELSRMRVLLRQAAEQGVRGFSTGLIYAPGSYADEAEIQALAQTAADCGLLYSTHMRNETDNLLEAVIQAIGVARTTGVRLEISHLKAMGPRNHGKVKRGLRLIDEARADGLDIAADVYPYTASSTTLTARLPGWALDSGPRALLERLDDEIQRRRVSFALAERFADETDPAGIVLAELPDGKYSNWTGCSLTEIAAAHDSTAHETAVDILASHRASVSIINHAMAEEDVEAALRHPRVAVASDGWTMTATGTGKPHPRSFGTFPRVLGHYVRERGTLPLAEAVRKMTSLPAARAGLTDRGRVAVGLAADLTIFDPATIIDRSTYADPWQLSTGVRHVIVNGRPALLNYQPITGRAGVVL